MYSQNDEETHIVKFFAPKGPEPLPQEYKGKFLDIGAYDGKTFSNTLKLFEKGWSGVCIEPSPSVFPALEQQYQGQRRVVLEQVAISKEYGQAEFFDSGGDAISSLCEKHKEKWEAGHDCKFESVTVETVPLSDIFDRHGFDFNFINLDVESLNLEIFDQMPFEKLDQLKLFCVEHDGHDVDMLARLNKFGFELVSVNGENLIVGRKYVPLPPDA